HRRSESAATHHRIRLYGHVCCVAAAAAKLKLKSTRLPHRTGIFEPNASARFLIASMFNRRQLLKLGALTLAASHLPRIFAEKNASKNILILGGTGFLGPPIVERALQHGHTVTLFNRGKSKDLFPNVEKIHGDRERGELDGLKTDRRWDVVIDVWANDPAV